MFTTFKAGLDRVQAFLDYKYGKRPLVKAAAALVVAIVTLFVGDYVVRHWSDIWLAINQFLALPVRLFGLIVFGVLLSLILLAFVDTSPTVAAVKEWAASRKQTKPRPLTREERAIAQPLRDLWILKGKDAAGGLIALYEFIQGHWKCRGDFAALLSNPKDDLKAWVEGMDRAVTGDADMSAPRIHEQFNKTYDRYCQACFWIARVAADQDLHNTNPGYREWRDKWAESHKLFYGEMERVDLIREHAGELRFRRMILDDGLSRFLRSAQVTL